MIIKIPKQIELANSKSKKNWLIRISIYAKTSVINPYFIIDGSLKLINF